MEHKSKFMKRFICRVDEQTQEAKGRPELALQATGGLARWRMRNEHYDLGMVRVTQGKGILETTTSTCCISRC